MRASGWERACGFQDINLVPEHLTCLWIPRKSAFNHPVPMSDTTSSHSPQVKFILEWLEVIRRKDLDNIAKPLPKDYRNIVYPRSLGRPEQTKEEYLEYVAELFNLWTEFEVCYISRYGPPFPWLSSPRSSPSIPSLTPQARSSITFVSPTLRPILHLLNLGPCSTGHLQGENHSRGRDKPRIGLRQTHRHRRRREPEDQGGRRVYRL